MRKITRKGLIRALDKEVSRIVRERDKHCVLCNTTENLTAGHLITRSKYSVRWDLKNIWCQCTSCNFRHEHQPEHFQLWYIDRFGLDAYKKLVLKSNQVRRKSDKELREFLEELKQYETPT